MSASHLSLALPLPLPFSICRTPQEYVIDIYTMEDLYDINVYTVHAGTKICKPLALAFIERYGCVFGVSIVQFGGVTAH